MVIAKRSPGKGKISYTTQPIEWFLLNQFITGCVESFELCTVFEQICVSVFPALMMSSDSFWLYL